MKILLAALLLFAGAARAAAQGQYQFNDGPRPRADVMATTVWKFAACSPVWTSPRARRRSGRNESCRRDSSKRFPPKRRRRGARIRPRQS